MAALEGHGHASAADGINGGGEHYTKSAGEIKPEQE